jgi:hypothetical protein
MPFSKILELEELVKKSEFIARIKAPKNGRGVGSLKTTKIKLSFSRTPM